MFSFLGVSIIFGVKIFLYTLFQWPGEIHVSNKTANVMYENHFDFIWQPNF